MRSAIRGHVYRELTSSSADNPAATLLTAIVMLSRRDIENVQRRGERASPAEKRDLQDAQRFLDWCMKEFADDLREAGTHGHEDILMDIPMRGK